MGQRSEHVGISNEKIGEIPVRRKSKVSVRTVHPLRVSRYPKPRPVGVGDGQQAKYSCTIYKRLSDGVTQEDKLTWIMDCQAKYKEGRCREIRRAVNLEVLWVFQFLGKGIFN